MVGIPKTYTGRSVFIYYVKQIIQLLHIISFLHVLIYTLKESEKISFQLLVFEIYLLVMPKI
jgi:hypothetical protein